MSKVTMYQAVKDGPLFTMEQLVSVGWTPSQVRIFCSGVEVSLPAAQVAVIDWSEAPEGATHGRVTTAGIDFYRRLGGIWGYLNSRNQWERAYGTSEADCQERPKPTPATLRNKACDEMFGVILKLPENRRHNRSDIVEALYDAGYRKFEIVDGEA